MNIPEKYLLGVKINPITQTEFLQYISQAVEDGKPEYVVTPYSEFIYNAQKDQEFKDVINNSYLSITDGVFIQWATKYLSMPLKARGVFRAIGAIFQYVVSGAAIVLYPKFIKSTVKDRISGSRVIYDLSKLAAEKGYKVAILGGFDFGTGNTGTLSAKRLMEMYPGLEITEVYPGDREKEEFGEPVIKLLKESQADILYCCYGPVRQEKWLAENLAKTGITVGIGLGGTLDYVSGVKKPAPQWAHELGIEWLIRPIYSEGFKGLWKRINRAWIKGFLLSSLMVLRYKIRNPQDNN